MRTFLLCFFLSLLAVRAPAEAPVPAAGTERKAPPGLEGLVWNKWDAGRFSVLSIDKEEGSRLKDFVEPMRRGLIERWGIKESDSFHCKLACVPDPAMLWKLFGLKDPKCEVSEDGKEVAVAIWVDSKRIDLLPSLLAEAELGAGAYPEFVRNGVPLLEREPSWIGELLKNSDSAPLASVLDGAAGPHLGANSALLCLMIRREYGRRAFGVASSASPSSLYERLGFRTQKQLEDTFARYRANLVGDIESGRTPLEYLGANP